MSAKWLSPCLTAYLAGSPYYDDHEGVWYYHDARTGVKAYVGIHKPAFACGADHIGPAAGGLRVALLSHEEAVNEALRLSRIMTEKFHHAGLPYKGGKMVLIRKPGTPVHEEYWKSVGEFLRTFKGGFITGLDSGIELDELRRIAQTAPESIAGITPKETLFGAAHIEAGPAVATAYGLRVAALAAARYHLGVASLSGLRILVIGLGHIGTPAAVLFQQAGATLLVSDTNEERVAWAVQTLDAIPVDPNRVLECETDILVLCVKDGGFFDDETARQVDAKITLGATNGQLARDSAGRMLFKRNVCFVPDTMASCAGAVDIVFEREGRSLAQLREHIDGMGSKLIGLFREANEKNEPPFTVARARVDRELAKLGPIEVDIPPIPTRAMQR